MSTNVTCNGSFWTKEEDIIFENALAMHFDDKDLLKKMEAALPGKPVDEILHHYNELAEDINSIEFGSVQLRSYPEMQSNANQNLKADAKWRKGIPWTEQEHRLFLGGLEIYGKGDWRSISRHSVRSRTSKQVASHAQKFFKRHSVPNKRHKRASILDIVSVNAVAAGTSQVPNTEGMIGPACGGSQVVTNTRNEAEDMTGPASGGVQAMRNTRNEAEDMTGPASGGLQAMRNTRNEAEDMTGPASGGLQAMTNIRNEAEDMTGPASGDARNGSTLPEESTNAELQMIALAGGIDDPMTEQEGANETAFLVATDEIGSDLEALLADPMEEDISSIFAASSSNAAAEAPARFVLPRLPSSNTPPDEEALRYVDDLFMD